MTSATRRSLFILLAAGFALLVSSVIVFHHALNISWLDAVYFTITTLTTVGYGDFSLRSAPPIVKVFGIIVMIGGVASMAAILAIMTDSLVQSRLDSVFGRRRANMRDHVVLCGLGAVGVRILEHLNRIGEKVTAVEQDEDNTFLSAAKQMNVPIIKGDIRMQSTLEDAGVAQAKCLIAATDNDLANLEAALGARQIAPEIRVVLRVFDQSLANKIRDGFGFSTAFSTQSLSAPAFAMAAIDASVVGSFFVGEGLMLNVELVITRDSALDGMSTKALVEEGQYAMLVHESAATAERTLNPSKPITLGAGDRIIVATPREGLTRLHELNAATDEG